MLHAINCKFEPRAPPALHVEAVRDGEEPISFGPSAALADYRSCWRLQTVTAQDAPGIHHAPHAERQRRRVFFYIFFENLLPSVDLALGKGFAVTVTLAVTATFLYRVSD
jgi:hypothetical protein